MNEGLVGGHRPAEDMLIAAGRAVCASLRLGKVGACHPKRGEDMLLDVAREGLAGDRLDQHCQDDIVHIGVLIAFAGRLIEPYPLEGTYAILEYAWIRSVIEEVVGTRHGRKAARVREQMAHGDLAA